ncbi:hypothetical protein [Novosphingobium sp. P6W]|uniref:hypothetical protein n=1 Tax=Novosphingobium sp. P6W TaxID=1609758 RepID=UPI0005C6F9F0|nr:hypothetical protein [Novosphingobium sp. P6W]
MVILERLGSYWRQTNMRPWVGTQELAESAEVGFSWPAIHLICGATISAAAAIEMREIDDYSWLKSRGKHRRGVD